MIWRASKNSISDLSYSKKVALFGNKYNMCGLDYYAGGVYDKSPGVGGMADTSSLIGSWDWRERHGANDPAKEAFYYDKDTNGSGWLTPPEDQNAHPNCPGLCYIYAPVGAIEGVANLYLNRHADFNLSEQHVLDCDDYYALYQCDSGYCSSTHTFAQDSGIVNEECYLDDSPNEVCIHNPYPNGSPQYRIKIPGRSQLPYYSSNDDIKQVIIDSGALKVTLYDYTNSDINHFIDLIGYKVLQAYDTFQVISDGLPVNIVVNPNSDYIGQLAWLYRNSYGINWGEKGFVYHLDSDYHPYEVNYYHLPIDNTMSDEDTVTYRDADLDGYWNWGISEDNPVPDPCSAERDSDDSENRLGPFDGNYFSVPVKPEIKVCNIAMGTANQYIENGDFFYFDIGNLTEKTFTYRIENPGSAQLNLVQLQPITSDNLNYVVDSEHLNPRICMEGGYSEFDIIFHKNPNGDDEIGVITIHVADCDTDIIDKFTFAMVNCSESITPQLDTIQYSQDWPDFQFRPFDYLIPTGVTLTVTGDITLSNESDIFIEPGGKLIIDGGRLTGSCNDLWNGIDVWGDARLPQTPAYQGVVEVTNGGTIEFADTAIATVKKYNGYIIPSGGLVFCTDGVFLNNYMGICFHPYSYPQGSINPNQSWLCRTSFLINDDFYSLESNPYTAPRSCISMDDICGLRIRGCSFVNSSAAAKRSRGCGIINMNAGYSVKGTCAVPDEVPCSNYLASSFDGWDYGIKSLNDWSTKTLWIDSADFIDNYRGIYMSLTNDATIIKNRFELNADNPYFFPEDTLIGIYTDHCNRFQIEENKITGSNPENYNLVGMHILNSGTEYNEIYNDSLVNLTYGIIAAGENRNKDGTDGLCIKCNDFVNCLTDVYITPEGGSNPDFLGIATTQGQLGSQAPPGVDPNSMGAGNTFTKDDFVELNYNFYNDPDLDLINYTHQPNTPREKLRPAPYNNIQRIEDGFVRYSKDTSCPSHLNPGGIQIELEKSTFFENSEIVSFYVDTLNQYIDGGDTQSLNFEIQTSFPDDALPLRQQLLEESPFLSDTVLISAIERENVLLNPMIKDILVANPQSAKSSDVQNTLDAKFDPLPDYMRAEIMEGVSIFGEKELLERQLSLYSTFAGLSNSRIIKYFINDTASAHPLDSIFELMDTVNSIMAEYDLAFCKLTVNDTSGALSILNNIPLTYTFNSTQSYSHSLYQDLFDIVVYLASDSTVIDSISTINLLNLAEENNETAGIYSRNYLLKAGLIDYDEPVYLPLYFKEVRVWGKPDPIIQNVTEYFKIFPNPAKTFFIVDYNIQDNLGTPVIVICNALGKTISSQILEHSQDQQVIDTKDLLSGQYYVFLILGNQIKETQIVCIIK